MARSEPEEAMSNAPRCVRVGTWGGAAVALAAIASLGSPAAAGDRPVRPTTTVRREPLRELGRRLFYDPAATSRLGMRACADCHHPGHGFSDPEKKSLDDTAPTKRHSQTLLDGADNPSGHWDGEFKRIDDLVRARLSVQFDGDGTARYGSGDAPEMRHFLSADFAVLRQGGAPTAEMRKAFAEGVQRAQREAAEEFAFASDDAEPLRAAAPSPGIEVLPAVASAERVFGRVESGGSELQPGFVNAQRVKGGAGLPDSPGQVAAARRYREAFLAAFGSEDVTAKRIGRAVAEFCHSIRSGESAYDRYVAGDSEALSDAAKRGLELFEGRAGCASCHTTTGARASFTDYRFHDTGVSWETAQGAASAGPEKPRGRRDDGVDHGRMDRTRQAQDDRRFKTPTLRDVARRGPYMHDGSLATLEDVVAYYVRGSDDPGLDPAFPKFAATGSDVNDLVAFLRSLTSARRPGLADAAWSERAPETRLELVDGAGAPLADLEVAIVPAGDVLPGFAADDAEPLRLRTDAAGVVTFGPRRATHSRLLLPDGLVPVSGDLVPDTCRSARVVVPVQGRTVLSVTFRRGDEAPKSLVARHPDSLAFPGRRLPVTVLRRTDVETTADGAVLATYDAPFRTDVGSASELVLPKPVLGLSSLRLFLDPEVPTVLTLP
jgi:cytochrome c peroxidase